jgi:hypothetical protein
LKTAATATITTRTTIIVTQNSPKHILENGHSGKINGTMENFSFSKQGAYIDLLEKQIRKQRGERN